MDIQPLGNPSRARPDAAPAYYPTVTPRRSPQNGDGPGTGAVYRPGPITSDGRSAAVPAAPGNGAAPPSPPAAAPPPIAAPPSSPIAAGPADPPPPTGTTAPAPQNGPPTPARPPGHPAAAARPTQPGHHPQPPTAPPQAAQPQLAHPQTGHAQAAHAQTGYPQTGASSAPVPGARPNPLPATVDPRAVPPQAPPTDPYQQMPWVSDGTPTAEEFARRRLAKPAEPTATMGARAMIRKGTLGLVKLAPGRHEQEFKQDVEMVRRNFGGLRQVTVVNPKGGAGKTVAVLLLAMTFGQKRGGYVLAWDNNETQGTLGMRAQQDFHARTVRDMMRDLHLFRGSHGRVGDLSQYVRAQGEGMFDVLASDESATAGEMLTASAFAEIREIVSRFYKLIMVDTGNNVRAQNWQAAMDATDQLVITMSARNDSAETAARMLDHLEQSGRQRLVRQAISVVSMPPTRKDIDLAANPAALRRTDPGGAHGAVRETDRLGRTAAVRPAVEPDQGRLAQDRRSRRRRAVGISARAARMSSGWGRCPNSSASAARAIENSQLSASAAAGSLSRRNWAHRAASSDSPIAAAACDRLCRQRRKPWLGSCDQGIGPCPFQPLRRSASRPRWYPVRAYAYAATGWCSASALAARAAQAALKAGKRPATAAYASSVPV